MEVGDETALYFEISDLLHNMEIKFYYNNLAQHVLGFMKTMWRKQLDSSNEIPLLKYFVLKRGRKINHNSIGCINKFLHEFQWLELCMFLLMFSKMCFGIC